MAGLIKTVLNKILSANVQSLNVLLQVMFTRQCRHGVNLIPIVSICFD